MGWLRPTNVVGALLVIVALWPSKEKADGPLKEVDSLFVSGYNQAAEGAREWIGGGQTCFALPVRAGDADAVLEITMDSRTQGVKLGPLGAGRRIARASLRLKSGEVVWSRSEDSPDELFLSGERTAGKLLVKRLARDAGCDERGERGGR